MMGQHHALGDACRATGENNGRDIVRLFVLKPRQHQTSQPHRSESGQKKAYPFISLGDPCWKFLKRDQPAFRFGWKFQEGFVRGDRGLDLSQFDARIKHFLANRIIQIHRNLAKQGHRKIHDRCRSTRWQVNPNIFLVAQLSLQSTSQNHRTKQCLAIVQLGTRTVNKARHFAHLAMHVEKRPSKAFPSFRQWWKCDIRLVRNGRHGGLKLSELMNIG